VDGINVLGFSAGGDYCSEPAVEVLIIRPNTTIQI
jgi:hypothetical protein